MGGEEEGGNKQQAVLSPHPQVVPQGPERRALFTKTRGISEPPSLPPQQPKPDKQVCPSSAQTAMGCGARQFNSFLHALSSLSRLKPTAADAPLKEEARLPVERRGHSFLPVDSLQLRSISALLETENPVSLCTHPSEAQM